LIFRLINNATQNNGKKKMKIGGPILRSEWNGEKGKKRKTIFIV
jgi:hypothetical protein